MPFTYEPTQAARRSVTFTLDDFFSWLDFGDWCSGVRVRQQRQTDEGSIWTRETSPSAFFYFFLFFIIFFFKSQSDTYLHSSFCVCKGSEVNVVVVIVAVFVSF